MIVTKRKNKGFNMVETIVASVILSGAVLTVGAISARSLNATRLNRQYEIAAALIDRQLSMIDYIGIDNFIERGQKEGFFDEYEPGFRWNVSTEYKDKDNLYLIKITVNWVERKRPYNITVDTMFNGIGALTDVTMIQE
jgi:type II secretory pathway pseudopilin PulG